MPSNPPRSTRLKHPIPRRLKHVWVVLMFAVTAACGNGGENHDMDHAMHASDSGEPVNYLVYDEQFSSAGMPDAAFIQRLAAEGVDTVINVAPPNANGSLEGEAEKVAAVNMTYVNIAVDWNEPTQQNVDEFLHVMTARKGDKVFLHCQMNMRATAFAMLHRVINQNVAPEQALDDMNTIWAPNRTWSTLINEALTRHGVDFAVPVPSE